MNTRLKITLAVAVATICMAACGNAGAKNDKKAKSTPENAVIELTSDTFNSLVYNTEAEDSEYLGDKPAIVDFNASWCGPCRRIAPILEELAEEYKGKIVIYKVDVDKCRAIAESFGISSIPALLFIPLEGEPVMTVGARDKAKFKSEIETILLQ